MTVNEMLQPILNTANPLTMEDSRETVPEWDSLAQINLIAAIEDAVGGELTTDEVLGIKSVVDVINVCRAHGLELTLG